MLTEGGWCREGCAGYTHGTSLIGSADFQW